MFALYEPNSITTKTISATPTHNGLDPSLNFIVRPKTLEEVESLKRQATSFITTNMGVIEETLKRNPNQFVAVYDKQTALVMTCRCSIKYLGTSSPPPLNTALVTIFTAVEQHYLALEQTFLSNPDTYNGLCDALAQTDIATYPEHHKLLIELKLRSTMKGAKLLAEQALPEPPKQATPELPKQSKNSEHSPTNSAIIIKEKQAAIKRIEIELKTLAGQFNRIIAEGEQETFFFAGQKTQLIASIGQSIFDDLEQYITANEAPPGFHIPFEPFNLYRRIMREVEDEDFRKAYYIQCVNRNAENKAVIARILYLRQQLASLYEFHGFADMQAVAAPFSSPTELNHFLETLAASMQVPLKESCAVLAQYPFTPEGILRPWNKDRANYLYAQQVHQQSTNNAIQLEFKPEHVVKEMLAIYSTMFGVHFKPIENHSHFWPESVVHYLVADQGGQILGQLHLDLYEYKGKKQSTHASQLVAAQRGDSIVLPQGIMFMNIMPNTSMKLEQVKSLFHELNHCMHYMLSTKTTLARFAGTNGLSRNAAETIGKAFEELVTEPMILSRIAQKAGAADTRVTEEEAKTYMAQQADLLFAMSTVQRVDAAVFDLSFHLVVQAMSCLNYGVADGDEAKIIQEITQVLDRVWIDSLSFFTAYLPEDTLYDKQYTDFRHIFSGGYACSMSAYVIADILKWLIVEAYKTQGSLEEGFGYKLRDIVLAPGGSQDFMQNMERLLGRKLDIRDLVDSYFRAVFPNHERVGAHKLKKTELRTLQEQVTLRQKENEGSGHEISPKSSHGMKLK